MPLKPYFSKNNQVECGLDEVGRGCLAGPVVAAAVVLPKDVTIADLNDSKKLSKPKRECLAKEIKLVALSYGIVAIAPQEIDKINILNASFLAMTKAVEKLVIKPDHLLVDGNRFKTHLDIPYTCIIKGDGKFASIAAASILAKTYRDDFMQQKALEYPGYGWETNVGYPTIHHREALNLLGITPLHRKSFNLSYQLKIESKKEA